MELQNVTSEANFNLKDFQEIAGKMNDLILNSIKKMELNLLKQVLGELLKREPTEDDFKKVSKKHFGDRNDNYKLLFQDIELGTVKEVWEEQLPIERETKFYIKFIPNKTFK